MTPRSLLASAVGALTGVAALAALRLDVALVSFYRHDRTWPYRALMAALVFLGSVAIARARRDPGPTAALPRAVLLGAGVGYVAGAVAWFVMTVAFLAPASAAAALAEAPRGLLAPLAVPLVTFAWLAGAIAAVVAEALRRR